MKLFILFTSLLLNLPLLFAQSLDRHRIEAILKNRQIHLAKLEAQGHRLLIGEVTGAGRSIPLNRVAIFVTENQAILNHEIDSYDTQTPASLGNMLSLRSMGTYFLNSDIKAVIVR